MTEAILGFLSLLVTVVIGGLFSQVKALDQKHDKRITALESKVDEIQKSRDEERAVNGILHTAYEVLRLQAQEVCRILRKGQDPGDDQLRFIEEKRTADEIEKAGRRLVTHRDPEIVAASH